ncbi:UNVERIFIED_CONTAM: hypothetical protein Sangu_2728400 [Sesamum angustifolium]|uniref:Uncharacterized protein n=1 Tax=Sesamum angustifolium TaxID=2727405 RepID=A0AAW2IWR6_9LAMI
MGRIGCTGQGGGGAHAKPSRTCENDKDMVSRNDQWDENGRLRKMRLRYAGGHSMKTKERAICRTRQHLSRTQKYEGAIIAWSVPTWRQIRSK